MVLGLEPGMGLGMEFGTRLAMGQACDWPRGGYRAEIGHWARKKDRVTSLSWDWTWHEVGHGAGNCAGHDGGHEAEHGTGTGLVVAGRRAVYTAALKKPKNLFDPVR